MTASIRVIESSLTTPKVRAVPLERPWEWLGAGWKDLWRAPAASISYGLLFAIMGYILVSLVVTRFQFALALTTGFLLAGPFLAMGLYDISRRLEAGEVPTFGQALTAWRHNMLPILLFGLLIGLLMIVWVRLSALLFGVIVLSLIHICTISTRTRSSPTCPLICACGNRTGNTCWPISTNWW